MATLYAALVQFVGDPPAGSEPVVYVIAACFAFYMVSSFFSFLVSLLRR